MAPNNTFSVLCEENIICSRKDTLRQSSKKSQNTSNNIESTILNCISTFSDTAKWADIRDDEDYDASLSLSDSNIMISGSPNSLLNEINSVDDSCDSISESEDIDNMLLVSSSDLDRKKTGNYIMTGCNATQHSNKNIKEQKNSDLLNCKFLSKKDKQKKEELELEEFDDILQSFRITTQNPLQNSSESIDILNQESISILNNNDEKVKLYSKKKLKKKKKNSESLLGDKKILEIKSSENGLPEKVQNEAIINIRKMLSCNKKVNVNGMYDEAILEAQKKAGLKKKQQKKEKHMYEKWPK